MSAFAASPPPVSGGEADTAHPEVVLLLLGDAAGDPLGVCTGTRVSPTAVLTAAHCLDASAGPAPAQVWVVSAPALSDATTADTVAATGWEPHPDADPLTGAADLAVVTHPTVAGPVAAIDLTPLTAAHLDAELLLVGYGGTAEADPNDDPSRRAATVPLYDLDAALLYTWTPAANACAGDSGGPLFRRRADGELAIVGLVSFTSGCEGGGLGGPRVAPAAAWLAELVPEVRLLAAEAPTDTGDTPPPDDCGCAHTGALPAAGTLAAWVAMCRRKRR